MTIAAPPPGLQPEEYDDIVAAIMETARGRAFLSEHARRARSEDTEQLRKSLAKIEARLDALGAPPKVEAVPVIARLDRLAWTLRESGVDDFVCSKLEKLASDLAAGGILPESPSPPPDISGAAPSGATDRTVVRVDLAEPAPSELENLANVSPASVPKEELSSVRSQEAIRLAPPSIDPPLKPDATKQDLRSPPSSTDALLWLDHLPLLDRMALFA